MTPLNPEETRHFRELCKLRAEIEGLKEDHANAGRAYAEASARDHAKICGLRDDMVRFVSKLDMAIVSNFRLMDEANKLRAELGRPLVNHVSLTPASDAWIDLAAKELAYTHWHLDREEKAEIFAGIIRKHAAQSPGSGEALREALAFYADKSNWDDRMTGSEGGEEEATVYTYGEQEVILCGAKSDEHGWERAERALAASSPQLKVAPQEGEANEFIVEHRRNPTYQELAAWLQKKLDQCRADLESEMLAQPATPPLPSGEAERIAKLEEDLQDITARRVRAAIDAAMQADAGREEK